MGDFKKIFRELPLATIKRLNPYPSIFTLVFLIIIFQYSFTSIEVLFYDWKIRTDFGVSHPNKFVLITLDEESDEFLGEKYPYTLVTHKRLFEKIKNEHPAIVGYLVAPTEPQSPIEREHLIELKEEINKIKKNGTDFKFGTGIDTFGIELPPSDLLDFGHALAIINIDNAYFANDNVTRRAILSFSGEESLHLWAANRIRHREGKEPLAPSAILGSSYDPEGDANFVNFRFSVAPKDKDHPYMTIPFHQVLVGNFPQGFFKDKVVIVGPRYRSNSSDYVLTSFSKDIYDTSKLSVHASIIESLSQNKSVYQVPKWVTYILSIMLALFLSVTISKSRPTSGLLTTIVFLFGSIVVTHLLFSFMSLWLYTSHLVLTVFITYYIWVPFRAIVEYQHRFAIEEESKLLKEVEGLKQNFISLMSHDLKTPVAKIAGVADVLKQKAESIEIKEGLQSIIDSTKELNKFISSILDLTKVESRKISLNLTSKDINAVIENVANELSYEAESKKITVELILSPLYPIQMDTILMKRVLSNLVENAIKYSGEGSRVEIKTREEDVWVFVEISDNGIGIPPDDLKHVFDKFYRVKNDSTHKIKGTGLGLYLVKYFVELHGGQIMAVSTVGQGTTFVVKLKNS